MSVKAPELRWLTGQPHKPASEMTADEWESYKRELDTIRAERGEPAIRWDLFSQPQPLTEADIARTRELAERLGLKR